MTPRQAREDDFERVTELLEILGRDVVTPETAAECRRVFEAQVVGQESGAAGGRGRLGPRDRLLLAALPPAAEPPRRPTPGYPT